MRLWFDEDLSPTLVQMANERGFDATCNRDRGVLGRKDPQLRQLVQSEEYVFVTDNASDFRPMYERDEVHPGLVVMPAEVTRERQQQLVGTLISWIMTAAAADQQSPADFMVNKLVEVNNEGGCTVRDIPPG